MFVGSFDGAPLCAGLWFWRGSTGLWIRSWPQTGGQTWGDLTVGSRGHLVATDHSSQGCPTSGNCCSSVPLKNGDKHGCPSNLKFIFLNIKKTFKNNKKKAVSLSLEPVTGRGLTFICTPRDQVSLEIWFNWSSSPPTPPPPHPHSHTHTHDLKKNYFSFIYNSVLEQNTHPSASFSSLDYSCVQNAHLQTRTHAHRRIATWLFRHADRATRTRPPLTPQPLGFWLHPQRVWLWERWSQGQSKAAHCFTCPGGARSAQGFEQRDLAESLMIWSRMNRQDLVLRDRLGQKSPRLALICPWWPGHHPALTLLALGQATGSLITTAKSLSHTPSPHLFTISSSSSPPLSNLPSSIFHTRGQTVLATQEHNRLLTEISEMESWREWDACFIFLFFFYPCAGHRHPEHCCADWKEGGDACEDSRCGRRRSSHWCVRLHRL